MKKTELVFVPSPGVGHLVPAVEISKLMVDRDGLISITVLVMKPPFDSKINNYLDSLAAASISDRIRFIHLPSNNGQQTHHSNFLTWFIESQKTHVKEAVSKLIQPESSPADSPQLAAFVVGMFCTTMIDVANEFGVPSYVFFASSAASLGLMLHLQALNDEKNVDTTEFKDSDTELVIPSFVNPVPARVFPSVVFDKDWHPLYYGNARRFREAKGIMVNTLMELESHAINSFSNGETETPPVYPVGPILNLKGDGHDVGSEGSDIMQWLDDQSPLSVVFLCFGSMGSFGVDQVKEIAYALEHGGFHFLWSLRQPPPKGKMGFPSDYANPAETLPEGFLDRTAGIGKVIGWAPQVSILSHPSIGGFVSHCGWNSILESLWFGVPIATWPLFSEQQLNAFEMIVELGLAAEIKMDYRKDFRSENELIVCANDIEKGMMRVMEHDSEIRNKVKKMSETSRKALSYDRSSYSMLSRVIEDVMSHIT